MSEFGKGYAYCLGLFLAHSERNRMPFEEHQENQSMWFYAASDHLAEMIIPESLPIDDKNLARELSERSFKNRWDEVTCGPEDRKWAIDTAKTLLLRYDKYNGVEAEQADYK